MGARLSRSASRADACPGPEGAPAMRTAVAAAEVAVAQIAAKEAATGWLAAHPGLQRPRFFLVIFRHHSGKTKLLIEQIVRPLLDAASIQYLIVPSKFKGSPASFFHTHEFANTDGILVLGSDSFLNEVITGLFERFHELPCPVGVVPCGHANALASYLDDSPIPLAREQSAIQAVLRAIRGESRSLDIMRVSTASGRRYALTHVGWGLPGAIAVHMDRLRWVPHHTTCDAASLITRARHWPRSRCVLSFPVEPHEAGPVTTDTPHHTPPLPAPGSSPRPPDLWEERNFAVHGILASTLPTLGPNSPISQDVVDDDGHMVVALVPASIPKTELIRIALEMKKGKYLADSKSVVALRVREFRLSPHDGLADVPYIVDGEPMSSGSVHVRVLPRHLPVFASRPGATEARPMSAFSDHTVTLSSPLPALTAGPSASDPSLVTLASGAPLPSVSTMAEATESSLDCAFSPTPTTTNTTPHSAATRVSVPNLVSPVLSMTAPDGSQGRFDFTRSAVASLPSRTMSGSVMRCNPGQGTLSPPPSACELRPRATSPAISVSKEEVHAYLQQAGGSFMRRRLISRHFSVNELREEDEEEEKVEQTIEHTTLLSPHSSLPVEGLEMFDEKSESLAEEEHRMRAASIANHCQHAVSLAAARGPSACPPTHLTIIYNPVSGQGRARRVIDQIVLPVLEAARVPYTLFATQHRGHATEHVRDLDPSTTSGVVVCGGDGMVSEVVTGLMQNTDTRAADMPVGLIAVGTANAMATHIDGGRAKTKVELIANAALALVKGHTTCVDVLELVTREGTRHALSCLGWAFAGEVTKQADRLRSLAVPGQKNARYEIAGIVTLAAHWPVTTEARIGYAATEIGPDGKPVEVWKQENITCVNLIASNLPILGDGNPICRDIAPDDGKLAICNIANIGRTGTVRTAMFMKRGHYLADHHLVRTIITREFTLLPLEGTPGCRIPYNVDGDPVPAQPIRVRVLHRRLRLFCLDACASATASPSDSHSHARDVTQSSPPAAIPHSTGPDSALFAGRAQSEPVRLSSSPPHVAAASVPPPPLSAAPSFVHAAPVPLSLSTPKDSSVVVLPRPSHAVPRVSSV